MELAQIIEMEPENKPGVAKLFVEAWNKSPSFKINGANNDWVQGIYFEFKQVGLRHFNVFFLGTHKETGKFVLEIVS
ncbi:hypothetical protein PS2_035 [Serratia phage PS2]|uniref:Uncharacterized protein n=1 Tax=Serratia phage PS2 TaxID=1481112 RepID=A0A023W4W7_9CAUD|nr:hypothetical protein FF83_gp035 [Serratia phage PS2]AHY25285.1 hypothetical protein PS2_035 [Serratia phage PS2]